MEPNEQYIPPWWRSPFLWAPICLAVLVPLTIEATTTSGKVLGLAIGAGIGAAVGAWLWWRLWRLGPDLSARVSYMPTSALSPEERAIRRRVRTDRIVVLVLLALSAFCSAGALPEVEFLSMMLAMVVVLVAAAFARSLPLWGRCLQRGESPIWWRSPFEWAPIVAILVGYFALRAIFVLRGHLTLGMILCLVIGAGVGAATGAWIWWQVRRLGPDHTVRITYMPLRALSPEERAIRRRWKGALRAALFLPILVNLGVSWRLPDREAFAVFVAEILAFTAVGFPAWIYLWRLRRRLSKPTEAV